MRIEKLKTTDISFRRVLHSSEETKSLSKGGNPVNKDAAGKVSNISKNKWVNLGGIIFALGLIAIVISLVDKGLDKQTGPKNKINTKV